MSVYKIEFIVNCLNNQIFGNKIFQSKMWKVKSECLSVHNIEVQAPIGVFEFEKKEGNTFLVSVDLWGDYTSSRLSDQLADTLDYQLVHNIVLSTMDEGGDLIESVAERMIQRILNISFPLIRVRVYIQKLAPPLGGKVDATSFELMIEKV